MTKLGSKKKSTTKFGQEGMVNDQIQTRCNLINDKIQLRKKATTKCSQDDVVNDKIWLRRNNQAQNLFKKIWSMKEFGPEDMIEVWLRRKSQL